MGAVGVFRRQHQLGKGGHLDVAVGVAVVPDGDAPRLAIALRDDDAFDLGPERRRPS